MRVYRHDTGREHDIPDALLRWGPETLQGTCRADLLKPAGKRSVVASLEDVPYILPFSVAKWAVRVTTLPERADQPMPPGFCLKCARPLSLHGIACPTLQAGARARLGSLLDAAADALRAEAEEERPDALGEALELLAASIEWTDPRQALALAVRVRAFLERETSAEIRRERKGPILSDGDVGTLRVAIALLRHTPADRDIADALCDLTDRLVFWRRWKEGARG